MIKKITSYSRKRFLRLFYSIKQKMLDFYSAPIYRQTKQADTLYAFYDLSTSALDFGVVVFLSIAEEERIRLGVKNLCLVVVPETDNDLQKRKNKRLAILENKSELLIQDDWEWRLRNIIMPSISSLAPHCQIKVFSTRKEAHYFEKFFVKFIFPTKYSMSNSTSVNINYKNTTLSYLIKAFQKTTPSIKSSSRAIQYVSEWIKLNAKGKKVITITLREYIRQPKRNSRLKEWADFARSIDNNIFFPVILRDTDEDLRFPPQELDGLTVFHQPVWNIELRSALYELSYLNLYKDNGSCCFCILNRNVRYLNFHSMIDPVIDNWKDEGMHFGASYPWSNQFQKIVWKEDYCNNIKQEFDVMCGKIEKFENNNKKLKNYKL